MRRMKMAFGKRHVEISLLNDVAQRNKAVIWITLDMSHLEMSPLNELADINIPDMSLTFETSHFDKSPLKEAE